MTNFRDEMEKYWKRLMDLDGISKEFDQEEFVAEARKEKERITGIIESDLLASCTLGGMSGGLTNYFIISDPAFGSICPDCGATSFVVLLRNNNYTEFEEKVFFPSFESYKAKGITVSTEDSEYIRQAAVPVDPKTDVWYCPFCDNLAEFSYSSEMGINFDGPEIDLDQEKIKQYAEEKEEQMLEVEEQIAKLQGKDKEEIDQVIGDFLDQMK